jgi:hypothetical protein
MSGLLLPAWVPGVMAILAALAKLFEYRRNGTDFLRWCGVLCRIGIGLIYLGAPLSIVPNDTTIELRFLITIMFLVSCLVALRHEVMWQRIKRTHGERRGR